MAPAFNRYYDPTTDQFLSVDPDVARTNQPYTYVNDSPLNATDPTGLLPSAGGSLTNAETAALAKSLKQAAANGVAEKEAAQAVVVAKIMKVLASKNVDYLGTIADVSYEVVQETSAPFEDITPGDTNKILAGIGVATKDIGNTVTAIAPAVTAYNDLQNGDGVFYSAGDGLATTVGAVSFAAVCGGPVDPAAVVCALAGGYVGATFGHDVWNKFFG